MATQTGCESLDKGQWPVFPNTTYPYLIPGGNMQSFQTDQIARGATEYRTIVHDSNYVSLARAIGALTQDHMSGCLQAK
eukprot:6182694-Karenia_brevis.AAC.1